MLKALAIATHVRTLEIIKQGKRQGNANSMGLFSAVFI